MTYPISEIEGMSAFWAAKLKSLGIRTTDALLEATHSVKGRKAVAAKTGISEQQLLEWANVSDYMRIPGMGKAKVGLVRERRESVVRFGQPSVVLTPTRRPRKATAWPRPQPPFQPVGHLTRCCDRC